jgi:hypothetical protein
MNEALNTAQAYLDAGNLVSARRLIEEALSHNPDSLDASMLLVSLENQEAGPLAVLDLTARFIPQWPDDVRLRIKRLSALAELEYADEMRRELAMFRSQFIYYPEVYEFWCGVFEVRFGSGIHAAHHLDNLRKRGDQMGFATALESLIAVGNADFITNERIVRGWLAEGRTDAATIADLSLCEFFNLRIGAAWRTAKTALAQDPRESTAKAVLALSWLVWFPPFFFAQLCMLPSGADGSGQSAFMRFFLGAIDFWLIVLLMMAVAVFAIWPSGWTAVGIVALLIGWWSWTRVVNGVLAFYGRRAKQVRHVDLRDF